MKPRVPRPDCGHRPMRGLSRRRHAAALEAAEARCIAAGAPWSDVRRRVYDLLLNAQKPLGAYDLLRRFAPGGRPPGPPVVYRALESLMRAGLVHRVVSADKFIACANPGSPHAAAFLICDCCGCADEVAEPEFRPALGIGDRFKVQTVLLELHGRCGSCRV